MLLDLLTIKTILSFGQHPIRWLVKISAIPFAISFLILFFSFDKILDNNIVIPSLVVLFFSLGVFLVSLGMIVELIYFKGNFRIKDVSTMAITSAATDKL